MAKQHKINGKNILIIDREHICCKVEFYKIEKKSTLRRVLFVCEKLFCNIEYENKVGGEKSFIIKQNCF